jgi:hypothetical protein
VATTARRFHAQELLKTRAYLSERKVNRSRATAWPWLTSRAATRRVSSKRILLRGRWIVDPTQQAGLAVLDDLGDPADPSSDDRKAGRHRLDKGIAHSLRA